MILTKTYPSSKGFHSVIDELFSTFPSTWGNDVKSTAVAPANIVETENGFDLEFAVPGRNKEDFKINVDNGTLTVGYDKKEQPNLKEAKLVRREFAYESFKRSFALNEKINADGIEAKYESGILKVYLPKREEVKNTPKQISIQ